MCVCVCVCKARKQLGDDYRHSFELNRIESKMYNLDDFSPKSSDFLRALFCFYAFRPIRRQGVNGHKRRSK